MRNIILFIFVFLSGCLSKESKWDKKQDMHTRTLCCEETSTASLTEVKDLSLVNKELVLEFCNLDESIRSGIVFRLKKLGKNCKEKEIVSKVVDVEGSMLKIGNLNEDGVYRLYMRSFDLLTCGTIKFKVENLELELTKMVCIEYCN